jgi:four helix bundle protein
MKYRSIPNGEYAENGRRNYKGSKNMGQRDLKQRTKLFALAVIVFVESLPKRRTAEILGRQLLRSGTSVGANYRSACRARSAADFIAKMTIVEEEIDESIYWLELLVESKTIEMEKVEVLIKEANELLAIIVASIKTAKKNRK